MLGEIEEEEDHLGQGSVEDGMLAFLEALEGGDDDSDEDGELEQVPKKKAKKDKKAKEQAKAPEPSQPRPSKSLLSTTGLPEFKPLALMKPKRTLLPADLLDEPLDPHSIREARERAKFSVPLHSVIHAVSQSVAQKAGRNEGDAEVPRRDAEKKREREASARGLADKKEGKGRTAAADMFSESDSGQEDEDEMPRKKGKRVTDDDDGLDGEDAEALAYYASVVNEAKRRKLASEERSADAKALTIPLAPEDTDGKRGTNYAILKNRGLTAKKNKIDRNPRLKKRVKYEKMVKKLGSTKRIYKAGERRESGYRGEGTGISTGVRKSVKLG